MVGIYFNLLKKIPNSIVIGTIHKFDDHETISLDSKVVRFIFDEEKESYDIFPIKSDKSNLLEIFGRGGNMSIERNRYISLGGMDRSYSGASEDNDLVYRNIYYKVAI